MKPSSIICLMGPTASGKTDLALKICDTFPCDIISVDSAMIFKGMDIGTAKPDLATQQKYPHQLIDILDPKESYSVANFRKDALALIKQSHQNNRIPLLVGGTMLYFRGLTNGLAPLPEADQAIRDAFENEANEKGWDALHQKLQRLDPISAKRIHPNDKQRLQRALEVQQITGQALSDFLQEETDEVLPYDVLNIGLIPEDRDLLHHRIENRFNYMLQDGFVDEVKSLHTRNDLHENLPSMRCVGYRQVWKYLNNEHNYAEMRELGIIATRQLAKRQLTWLRKWNNLNRFDCFVDKCERKVVESIHKSIAL